MKVREWIHLVLGGIVTVVGTVVVFLFSYGFALAFSPFIALYEMITHSSSKRKKRKSNKTRKSNNDSKEKTETME